MFSTSTYDKMSSNSHYSKYIKSRKCSICRLPGHDKRKCPTKKLYLKEIEKKKLELGKEYSKHLNAECCICMEKGNVHNQLECGHYVHDYCIWKWIDSKANISYAVPDCPMCRTKLNFRQDSIRDCRCSTYDSDNKTHDMTLNKYYGRLIVKNNIFPWYNKYTKKMQKYSSDLELMIDLKNKVREVKNERNTPEVRFHSPCMRKVAAEDFAKLVEQKIIAEV